MSRSSALEPPASITGVPHRRYNPLVGQWVLVSAERTRRPWLGDVEDTPTEDLPVYDPECYLCPGNLRANGERNPAYDTTFVFTNDFPALLPDVPVEGFEDGLLRVESERGTSRVVCFSPQHHLTLASMDLAGIRSVVDLWAAQTEELGRGYRWVQVFENRGQAMGASNPHPHGQIWAGSALPNQAAVEDATQRAYWETTGRRMLCDYAAQERGGPRIVAEGGRWQALVPFWATWPYETMLVTDEPVTRLGELDGAGRDELARVLQDLLGAYDQLFGIPFPYSMGWHQAPFPADGSDASEPHWQLHAHFYPPLLQAGLRKFMVGYELLAEPQRDLLPEASAERLQVSRRAGLAARSVEVDGVRAPSG